MLLPLCVSVQGANILLNMRGEIKLTDFGVSDALGGSSDLIGSPYWMAPEVPEENSVLFCCCFVLSNCFSRWCRSGHTTVAATSGRSESRVIE